MYSRRADLPPEAGVRWESTADGEFSVETVTLPERGTRVVLHLKPDAREYADGFRLRTLVRRYSDHIAFPVRMRTEDKDGAPARGLRGGQPGPGPVDAAARRDHGRGVP